MPDSAYSTKKLGEIIQIDATLPVGHIDPVVSMVSVLELCAPLTWPIMDARYLEYSWPGSQKDHAVRTMVPDFIYLELLRAKDESGPFGLLCRMIKDEYPVNMFVCYGVPENNSGHLALNAHNLALVTYAQSGNPFAPAKDLALEFDPGTVAFQKRGGFFVPYRLSSLTFFGENMDTELHGYNGLDHLRKATGNHVRDITRKYLDVMLAGVRC